MANPSYNPDYHSSIVQNHRDVRERLKFNSRLILQDEEIYNIWNECQLYDDCKEFADEFPGLTGGIGLELNYSAWLHFAKEANDKAWTERSEQTEMARKSYGDY